MRQRELGENNFAHVIISIFRPTSFAYLKFHKGDDGSMYITEGIALITVNKKISLSNDYIYSNDLLIDCCHFYVCFEGLHMLQTGVCLK